MRLRAVLACIALAALAAVVPAAQAAAPACLKVADPKGDTAPAPDPALDITGFTLANVGPRLVATVTVDRSAVRPLYAPDSRIDVNFTVGGKRVTMFYKSSLQRAQEATAFYQQGIRVDNVFASGDMEAAVEGNTLTMKVKNTALRNVLAVNIDGVAYTGIQALARANYGHQDGNVTVDSADAPAGTRFLGVVACR